MRLLILDNYDSFTYNLLHLVEQAEGVQVTVKRNDEIGLEEVENYERILLSPGPGLPVDAGVMMDLIKRYGSTKNILGVCLGHQAIAESFGGKLMNLQRPSHGEAKATIVVDEEEGLYRGIPKTFQTGRYHSWAVEEKTLPSCLIVTAVDEVGVIMSFRHQELPIKGIQYHPESILSEYGKQIICNWLEG